MWIKSEEAVLEGTHTAYLNVLQKFIEINGGKPGYRWGKTPVHGYPPER